MGDLFQYSKEDYGSEYNEHLFEQYKLYVESIDRISDRRQNANNYFITINTVLISLLGFSFESSFFSNSEWVRIVVAVVGIAICIIFWFLIHSYKQLNTGKFHVLHEIEEKLPLSLYKHEWVVLKEGKDKSVYYPFSHVELIIPYVFGVVYLALGLIFLIK